MKKNFDFSEEGLVALVLIIGAVITVTAIVADTLTKIFSCGC